MLTGTTALPQPAFSTNADGTAVTVQSDPVFVGGSVGPNPLIFSPLRLSFKTKISNQLLKQAARIFEPVLRNIISRGISSMLDNLSLYGTGTNGQPLGICSATTPVAKTGSLAWADYKSAQQSVLETDGGRRAFLRNSKLYMISRNNLVQRIVAARARSSFSIGGFTSWRPAELDKLKWRMPVQPKSHSYQIVLDHG